jgi:GTPase SAR1 family protein
MPKKITMTMLGPEAVGKTTLLATMYSQLTTINETYEHGFDFAPAGNTGKDLRDALDKLREVIEKPAFTRLPPLLAGTAGIIERQFEASFQGKKELELSFYDIAGGLLVATDDENQDVKEFKRILNQAAVIINVIDGAALVEGSQLLSDSINQPVRTRELLRMAFNNQQKHLILFVITKCETWLKDEKGQKKLQKAFEDRHQAVINLMKGQQNVVGVLMPVKTLGCVEFSRIEGRGEDETIFFSRKTGLDFSPEKVDQPLRYALDFALSQHDQNRSGWSKFARWLSNKDRVFQIALGKFAQGRDRSFKVYGNRSLLDVI